MLVGTLGFWLDISSFLNSLKNTQKQSLQILSKIDIQKKFRKVLSEKMLSVGFLDRKSVV